MMTFIYCVLAGVGGLLAFVVCLVCFILFCDIIGPVPAWMRNCDCHEQKPRRRSKHYPE